MTHKTWVNLEPQGSYAVFFVRTTSVMWVVLTSLSSETKARMKRLLQKGCHYSASTLVTQL